MTMHFLRAWFLLGIPLTLFCMWYIRNHPFLASSWHYVCDKTLLDAMIKQKKVKFYANPLYLPLLSLIFAFIAAAGPTWKKLPTETYAAPYPKMIVLNISKHMLARDLSPNRIQRAKFIIQDLLDTPHIEPIGLLAYTSEPFNVAPITNDTKTIKALLPSLDTDTAPVDGDNLSEAIVQAAKVIQQAKFKSGTILVLTGSSPDENAINAARKLKEQNIDVSIMPIKRSKKILKNYYAFAKAGNGEVLNLSKTAIQNWAMTNNFAKVDVVNKNKLIPKWKDEGRWFILPALICMLPLFQRGRLQGI